jgi:hypothetical protein
VLSLSYCGLTTPSPPVPARTTNLTRLRVLDLSSNGINASTVDAWFWDVPTLRYLDLSGNSMSSVFPDALGNMTGLQALYLYGNDMVGMIPATLQRLSRLQVVDLSVNQINGDMWEFMDRLPRCALRRVQVLYVSETNMSGHLTERIGDMSELAYLDLSSNNPAGGIPRGIGRLSKLTRLFLLKNGLNGRLTEEHFVDMVSLEWIDLSQNKLSMEVRSSWRPPCKLWSMHISLTSRWVLSSVPCMDQAPARDQGPRHFPCRHRRYAAALVLEVLRRCGLPEHLCELDQGGRLPSSLRLMTSALAIYLGSNNLTGSVPLLREQLLVLDLSRNSLSGPIPSEFGGPELVELDVVSSNGVSGRNSIYVSSQTCCIWICQTTI